MLLVSLYININAYAKSIGKAVGVITFIPV
jgi:hypothetical protein